MALALALQTKFFCLHPASSLTRFLTWLKPKASVPIGLQAHRQHLHALVAAPVRCIHSCTKAAAPAVSASLLIAANEHTPSTMQKKTPASKSRLPLRIWHQTGIGQNGDTTQRMVISGRMSEVCAELDRLAAAEARHH